MMKIFPQREIVDCIKSRSEFGDGVLTNRFIDTRASLIGEWGRRAIPERGEISEVTTGRLDSLLLLLFLFCFYSAVPPPPPPIGDLQ